jgi:hypothetical protein
MVTELDYQLEDFSEVNRIRCFLHIVNLVAKSLLKQFNVNKKNRESSDPDAEELDELLAELTKEFEYEESLTQDLDSVADDELDDDDGVLYADETLTEVEQSEVDANIRPVKLVLAKVSSFTNHKPELIQGHLAPKTGI